MKTRIEASQRRVVNILHNHLNVMNLIWLTLTALLATKFEIGQLVTLKVSKSLPTKVHLSSWFLHWDGNENI